MPHEMGLHPAPPINILRMLEDELRKEANKQLQKLKELAMNKAAEVINQIPYIIYTPPKDFQVDKEAIKQLLLGYACTPPSADIVKKVKDRALSLIDKVTSKVTSLKDVIDRIHAKVEKFLLGLIDFNLLLDIVGTLQKIYSRVHIALFIIVNVAPLSFLSGGAFQKLVETQKYFSRANKVLKAIKFAFTKVKEALRNLIVNTLKPLVDKAKQMIQLVVDMINKIKTLIEMYYLQFLALCEGVSFPPDGLEAQVNGLLNNLNSGFGLEDFFTELLQNAQNNTLFLRQLYNAKFEKIGHSKINRQLLEYYLEQAVDRDDLDNILPL